MWGKLGWKELQTVRCQAKPGGPPPFTGRTRPSLWVSGVSPAHLGSAQLALHSRSSLHCPPQRSEGET